MTDPRALQKLLQAGQVWFADHSAEDLFSCSRRQELAVEKISALPDLQARVPAAGFGVPEIDAWLPSGGLSLGALHEFCTALPETAALDKLTFAPCAIPAVVAANTLKGILKLEPGVPENFSKFIFWIGRNCWPTPFLLKALLGAVPAGHDFPQPIDLLSHCLLLDPPDLKLKLWCLETTLRSPAAAAVITDINKISFALTRKFSLLAKKASSLGILIKTPKEQAAASAALTSWRITPQPSASGMPQWQLTLLKCRGRQPLKREWLLELGEEPAGGRNGEKIFLRIPAVVELRSDAPEIGKVAGL